MTPEQIEIFERAFSGGTSSCRMTCNCGREFFYDYNSGYSWDEGELEKLRERADTARKQGIIHPMTVACDYAPSEIRFDGRSYVDACDCWHERATKVRHFLMTHRRQVGMLFKLEREASIRNAESIPVIENDDKP